MTEIKTDEQGFWSGVCSHCGVPVRTSGLCPQCGGPMVPPESKSQTGGVKMDGSEKAAEPEKAESREKQRILLEHAKQFRLDAHQLAKLGIGFSFVSLFFSGAAMSTGDVRFSALSGLAILGGAVQLAGSFASKWEAGKILGEIRQIRKARNVPNRIP